MSCVVKCNKCKNSFSGSEVKYIDHNIWFTSFIEKSSNRHLHQINVNKYTFICIQCFSKLLCDYYNEVQTQSKTVLIKGGTIDAN